MPGYPAFVAASIRLSETLGVPEGRQYFVARLLMALVGTLNCGLVAWLGSELFDAPHRQSGGGDRRRGATVDRIQRDPAE